jgi:hypothetical protein
MKLLVAHVVRKLQILSERTSLDVCSVTCSVLWKLCGETMWPTESVSVKQQKELSEPNQNEKNIKLFE